MSEPFVSVPHPLLPLFAAAGIADRRIGNHYGVSARQVRRWREREQIASAWVHPRKAPEPRVGPVIGYAEQELARFVKRAVGRKRRVAAEAWVDSPAMTRQKNYDQETERKRAFIRSNDERKAS